MEYIYLLKNKANNRVYVGRTTKPRERFKQHRNHLRAGTHPCELLQEDFCKHGENSFEFEIVEKRENFNRTNREGEWMIKLRTYDKKYGYNYKDPFFVFRNGKLTKNNPLRFEQIVE